MQDEIIPLWRGSIYTLQLNALRSVHVIQVVLQRTEGQSFMRSSAALGAYGFRDMLAGAEREPEPLISSRAMGSVMCCDCLR